MRIPKRFKLLGQTIEVVYEEKILSRNGLCGQARFDDNQIALLKHTSEIPRPATSVEQTFFHEMMHFVLTGAGFKELCADEQFVDIVGNLLHQVLTTAEYDEDTKK